MYQSLFLTNTRDHFNPIIASWQQVVKKIKYIVPPEVTRFGRRFKNDVKENLFEIGPGKVTVEGVTITTIVATDSGIGFLIKCDGLVIFHGDHALWDRSIETTYQAEIEKVKNTRIDIAFLPLQPRHPNKEIIREGALWAVKTLIPKVVIPMHLFGQYEEGETFVKMVSEQKLKAQAVCMNKRGQAYLYKDGSLKEQ